MLVVMVIIAAAMLLGVMATTGGTDRMQLHSSTKQIAANLRYTRAHAIATGEPQRFTIDPRGHAWQAPNGRHGTVPEALRSEEHTSELQSLMRISYAVFCLKKKKTKEEQI